MTPSPLPSPLGPSPLVRLPIQENGMHHNPTIDEGVSNLFHTVQDKVSHRYNELESYVRHSPGQAMVSAFAAGYLLKMLPVEAIVAAQVRLALAVVRPALFLYGAAKAYEFLARQKSHN